MKILRNRSARSKPCFLPDSAQNLFFRSLILSPACFLLKILRTDFISFWGKGEKMKAIKLYPQDTVALATADLKRGEAVVVDGQSIVLLDDIPNAHKIAMKDFKEGEAIRK